MHCKSKSGKLRVWRGWVHVLLMIFCMVVFTQEKLNKRRVERFFQENEKLNEIFEEFYRSRIQVLLLVVINL